MRHTTLIAHTLLLCLCLLVLECKCLLAWLNARASCLGRPLVLVAVALDQSWRASWCQTSREFLRVVLALLCMSLDLFLWRLSLVLCTSLGCALTCRAGAWAICCLLALWVCTDMAAIANSVASPANEEQSTISATQRRWVPTFRLLCAALELPYWALPAQVSVCKAVLALTLCYLRFTVSTVSVFPSIFTRG